MQTSAACSPGVSGLTLVTAISVFAWIAPFACNRETQYADS